MKITSPSPLQSPDTNSTVSNPDPSTPSPQDLQANLNQGIAQTMSNFDQIASAVLSPMGQDQLTDIQAQMANDRQNKMEEALSNAIKKLEDTADSVTQNLK